MTDMNWERYAPVVDMKIDELRSTFAKCRFSEYFGRGIGLLELLMTNTGLLGT